MISDLIVTYLSSYIFIVSIFLILRLSASLPSSSTLSLTHLFVFLSRFSSHNSSALPFLSHIIYPIFLSLLLISTLRRCLCCSLPLHSFFLSRFFNYHYCYSLSHCRRFMSTPVSIFRSLNSIYRCIYFTVYASLNISHSPSLLPLSIYLRIYVVYTYRSIHIIVYMILSLSPMILFYSLQSLRYMRYILLALFHLPRELYDIHALLQSYGTYVKAYTCI